MIIPLNDKVLVKVIKEEETTSVGIIIPKTSQNQKVSRSALVLNHGTSNLVNDGDVVVFEVYKAIKIETHKYENDDVLLIDDKNILAIIN